MSEQPSNAMSQPVRRSPPPWVLLAISTAAAGGVAALAWGARTGGDEVRVAVLPPAEVAALDLNLGSVTDTARQPGVRPQTGRRYRVHLASEAREGADAIARIGGMITFVSGGRAGETRVVEVTAVKKTTAEAVAVGEAATPAAPAGAPAAEAPAAPATVVYTGVVEGVGSRGDGRLKVDDVVIYVPGTAKGDRIVFEIVRKSDRFGTGRLVEKLAADAAAPAEAPAVPSAPAETNAPVATASNAAPVAAAADAGGPPKEGEERTVTITEKARRNPDTDGVVRLGGMVVIVPGSQPGQTVRIRITSVRERIAFGEVVPQAPAAPAPQ
ncbi:MAG: TRAM domain-containing protein [Lentisphaerae bacterium]|nr:TRAM domain-containing protein [Lentisphaerota bacterium]